MAYLQLHGGTEVAQCREHRLLGHLCEHEFLRCLFHKEHLCRGCISSLTLRMHTSASSRELAELRTASLHNNRRCIFKVDLAQLAQAQAVITQLLVSFISTRLTSCQGVKVKGATCRWRGMSVPSDARRLTASGMGTGAFWLWPGVGGMCWDTFSVIVRAEASYAGDTCTCGVPACPYLHMSKVCDRRQHSSQAANCMSRLRADDAFPGQPITICHRITHTSGISEGTITRLSRSVVQGARRVKGR